MVMEVILPANEIPEGSTVRKITGTKQYIINRGIPYNIFDKNGTKIEILGHKPLCITSGESCRCIEGTEKLVWVVDSDRLLFYIENKYDPESKQ